MDIGNNLNLELKESNLRFDTFVMTKNYDLAKTFYNKLNQISLNNLPEWKEYETFEEFEKFIESHSDFRNLTRQYCDKTAYTFILTKTNELIKSEHKFDNIHALLLSGNTFDLYLLNSTTLNERKKICRDIAIDIYFQIITHAYYLSKISSISPFSFGNV